MLLCNYTAAIYAKPIHSVSKCQPHVIPAQQAARVSLQPPPAIHLLFGRRRDSQVKADTPPTPHKENAQYIRSPLKASGSSTSSLLPPPRDRHGHVPKKRWAGTNGQATHRNGTRVEEQDTGFYHEYGQSPSITNKNVMRPCSVEECRHDDDLQATADRPRARRRAPTTTANAMSPKSPPTVPLEAYNS